MILIGVMSFYLTQVYNQIDNLDANKVGVKEMTQYMKLIEERQQLQKDFNDKILIRLDSYKLENNNEHHEILQRIDILNEKIHQWEIKYIGYIRTRGYENQRWDLQDVTLFMLENGVFDKPKYIGLI